MSAGKTRINTIITKHITQRRMGRKLPFKLQSSRPFTNFYSFFLAMIDRTLLLSNYLGNSFLQTEQPPKSEFPSHSSLTSHHHMSTDPHLHCTLYCRCRTWVVKPPRRTLPSACLLPLPRLRAQSNTSQEY